MLLLSQTVCGRVTKYLKDMRVRVSYKNEKHKGLERIQKNRSRSRVATMACFLRRYQSLTTQHLDGRFALDSISDGVLILELLDFNFP